MKPRDLPKAMVASAALAALFVLTRASAEEPGDLHELAFLVGSWEGEIGQAHLEEHWIPAGGGTMLGVSRTIVSGKTRSFEFLRIEKRDDGIVYVAQPGGRTPTEFRLTGHGQGSAVFENPAHDHPKVIRYRRSGESSLIARIEGDENGKPVAQEFVFRLSPSR